MRKLVFALVLSLSLVPVWSYTDAKVYTSAYEATEALKGQFGAKTVHTFVGYSGAGYENEKEVLAYARKILKTLDPSKTVINISTNDDGIGAIYKLAKEMGFQTSGVVSSQAIGVAEITKFCDVCILVKDETWGGIDPATGELSPTSKVMVGVSDALHGIGGNDVSKDELTAAVNMGKPVTFKPANMGKAYALKKNMNPEGTAAPAMRGLKLKPFKSLAALGIGSKATTCFTKGAISALQGLISPK